MRRAEQMKPPLANQRIVITGVGLAAPGAASLTEFRANLLAGKSGVSTIDLRYMGTHPAGRCTFAETRLWTTDGLATQAGDKTFWDRSTLYGLRGVFAAGETTKGLDYLKKYSERRLLGVHVPYPVEAYPEGDQKQLSGESALYCRVITEGMFGLRPTGLHSFTISPKLPDGWNEMALNKINAFGNTFDIVVKRDGSKTIVTINRVGKAPIVRKWNGKGILSIQL